MSQTLSSPKDSENNQLIQDRLDKKAAQRNLFSMVIPFFGLIFVFFFFTIATGGRLINPINVENLINQSFGLVIIAIGSTFVWAHGGKDMSIGPSAGCGMLVCALILQAGYPLWLAITGCILVTVTASSLVSTISIGLNVPVFIGSMCVRTSFLGILQYVTLREIVVIDFHKYSYMNNAILKAIIVIFFIFIGMYLFHYTSFGKYNKAIGGNIFTALQAGVKKKRNIYFAYLFCGLCVGVAAIFSLFRTGLVTGTTASGLEFDVMIAMALGGVPLSGGDKSRIISAIVGAVTVTLLINGLRVLGLQPMLVDGAKGILFVIIVALSHDKSEGKLVS